MGDKAPVLGSEQSGPPALDHGFHSITRPARAWSATRIEAEQAKMSASHRGTARPDAISRLATRKVATRTARMTTRGHDVRDARRTCGARVNLPYLGAAWGTGEPGSASDPFGIMAWKSFSCECQESTQDAR